MRIPLTVLLLFGLVVTQALPVNAANRQCIKLLMERYCLGGSLDEQIDLYKPSAISTSYGETVVVYNMHPGRKIMLGGSEKEDRVTYFIISYLGVRAWDKYLDIHDQLVKYNGPATKDNSYFPDGVNTDAEKLRAIVDLEQKYPKIAIFKVWNHEPVSIRLWWRRSGLTVHYSEKKFLADPY